MTARRKFLLSVIIGVIFFVFSPEIHAEVKINEFSSGTTSDWIEIYNLSTTESVDLSEYRLRDSTASNKKDLSGSLATESFISISFSNYLNKDGDLVKFIKVLPDSSEEIIDQIGYGDSGDICEPDSNQSIGRSPDGSGNFMRFDSQTEGASNTAGEAPCPSPIPSPSPTPTPTPTPSSSPSPEPEPDPTPSPSPSPTPRVSVKPTTTTTKKPAVISNSNSHNSEDMLISSPSGKVLGIEKPEAFEATESEKKKNPYLISIILVVLGLGLVGGTGVVFIKNAKYNKKHGKDEEV